MAKYDPDDIIKLALANPGFGFRRFVKKIYAKGGPSSESVILRLFEIHKHETSVDLFGIIQDTSKIRMVTEKEYRRITGRDYVPKGYGRNTGGRPSKANVGFGKGTYNQGDGSANIPLPPQHFDWLEFSQGIIENLPSGIHSANISLLYDFEEVVRMNQEVGVSTREISARTGVSEIKIKKLFSRMTEYDGYGAATHWLAVMGHLWKIQQHRGMDHRNDELMMDLRSIFLEYERDPVNVEAPSIEDINWVYLELLSEEE